MHEPATTGLSARRCPSSEPLPRLLYSVACWQPMDKFLLRAGFKPQLVPELLKVYEAEFKLKYPVRPFAGIAELIERLRAVPGLRLGIVSSNSSGNIRASLGEPLAASFHFLW